MRLLIIGAGGHGRVVGDVAESLGFDELVFFDNAWPDQKSTGRWKVEGTVEEAIALNQQGERCFVAIGRNSARSRISARVSVSSAPTLIAPSAIVSSDVRFGWGCVVVAGAIVNTGTTIGNGVILNTGCTIDHDCSIGDFAHISPGAHLAGGVHVGPSAWVGIGASVREMVRVGANAMVGAGAAVVKDVVDNDTVVGVPARRLIR